MHLLIRTPAPNPDESLFGFVLRVSELNGYDDPRYVLQVADVGRGQVQTPGFPIEKLARVLGRATDELTPIAYRRSEGEATSFKLLYHDLGGTLNGVLRLREPAVCPTCVQECGYISAFWDLSLAGICPKHGREVLHGCSACGNPLRWFRPGLLTCNCGARLSGGGCPKASTAAIELMRVVEARLYRRSLLALTNPAGFPLEALERMPFASLLQALKILGAQHVWATDVGAPASASDGHRVVAGAAACLENWPHGYHRFLSAFGERSLAERPSVVGLSKQFSPFYETMFRNRGIARHTGFLRDEFVAFGLQQWGHAAVDKKLLRGRPKPPDQRFISKSEFARRFGIWKPTMIRMISDGSVVTKTICTGKSSRTVVDLHSSQLPVDSGGVVNVRDAADYLGLPVSVLYELRAAGVFATKQRLGREASWHRDDVEQFLNRGLALASGPAEGASAIRVRDVMRRKLRESAAKADIIAAIFDARLKVVGRVGHDLGGLQLDRAQLDAFVRQKRVEVEDGTYSFPEAAIRTGLDSSTIANAIASGILTSANRDGRVRVTAASIDAFNELYVPVSGLAKRLGTLSRVLVRLCTENDIPVIHVARANRNAAQPIISRESQERILAVWQAMSAQRIRGGKANNTAMYEGLLSDYLHNLRMTGGTLPRRGGRLNRAAIARACGFCRHVFAAFPSVTAMLTAYEAFERARTGADSQVPVAALRQYLRQLRDTGALLPRSKRGRPNKLAIARACQFDRDVFYRNCEALALLEEHDAWERTVAQHARAA